MIKGKTVILSVTTIAAAAIPEGRLVGFDGRPAGENGKVLGVAAFDAKAGDAITIDVVGVIDMVAATAVNPGDDLSSNADGQPVAGGTNPFGTALNAANPGGRVPVLIR